MTGCGCVRQRPSTKLRCTIAGKGIGTWGLKAVGSRISRVQGKCDTTCPGDRCRRELFRFLLG